MFETPKVAVSEGPLGTVAGVQLVAIFQLPLVALVFHVALPAKISGAPERKRIEMNEWSFVFR